MKKSGGRLPGSRSTEKSLRARRTQVKQMESAIGIFETQGFTPAMVALDSLEKAAGIRLLQLELNDMLGACVKILGAPDAVQMALEAARPIAERMGGRPTTHLIHRPDPQAWKVIESVREFNPLIQQDVVHFPQDRAERAATTTGSAPSARSANAVSHSTTQEPRMSDEVTRALGFIETQGFTAVFDAIDTACKAADVEVVAKEKLGGGYITVVIRGDVAAVKAAIDAGSARVGSLGKLIAAHVIARPSASVLSLLPNR